MGDASTWIWGIAILFGAGLAMIVYSLIPRSLTTYDEDLAQVEAGRSGFLRAISPFLKTLTNQTVMWRGKRMDEYRAWLDRRIVMAGLEESIQTEEYIALHYFGAIAGAIFGLLIGFLFQGYSGLVGYFIWALLFAVFGAYMPFYYIQKKVAQRHKAVFRELPYDLDLLTVSVEAGLDFLGGLQRVSRETKPGPLRFEISRMLQQMQLGKTRVEVLRQMSERVNLTDLTSVVSALIQASQLGASLGPTLRLQAEMLRTKRTQRAEKLANEAPVKILFPLLFFIFPSIFIIILGPIVLQAVEQFTK